MRYRELTYEEACLLYDCGLRDGADYHVEGGPWYPDPNFEPANYSKDVCYRIPIDGE